MKNFLLGLSKFVLGIILSMLIMSLAALSMAKYFMTKNAERPDRPTYENDLPQDQRPNDSASNTDEGSASADLSAEGAPEPESEAEPATTASADAYDAYVTTDLNLRSGPGTSYDTIGGLRADESVTVIGEEDGWLNVILSSGEEGWVSGNYAVRE